MVENASTIDFYDENFKDKIAKIQKNKTVYVYCKSGGRSSKAAQLLVDAGHSKVINLQGGIMAWKRAGHTTTSFDDTHDSNIQEFSISDFNTVLSENNIVLVDFHTIWCAPCRKMAPMIDALEKDYENIASISRVDIDKSEELAEQYKIVAVPTLVLFEYGKEVWRNTGLLSKEDLVNELEKQLN